MRRAGRFAVVGVVGAVACMALSAPARPGDGVHMGNLVVSPFASLSITYDSNVYLAPRGDEQEDYFLDFVPGLAFINRTDRLIISGRGWGQFRRYDDATDKDSDTFGERVGAVWGYEDRLSLALNQKFIRLEDYEITPRSVDTLNLTSQNLMLTEDRTERLERDVFDISPVLSYKTSGPFEFDLGYSYGYVDYTSEQQFQGHELFDWHEDRVQIEARYRLSDRTSALLTGQYSLQDSDGFSDKSEFIILRGGLLYQVTAKTAVKAGAGVQEYDFGGESEAAQDLDSTIFNFDLAGTWEVTEKVDFEISGRNSIQPATQYDSNTKEVLLASAGFAYEVTETVSLSLAGSFRRDDYVGKVLVNEELRAKRRDLWGGRLRLGYEPRANFFDMYLEGSYEDVADNLEDDYNDYEQWRLSLGLALRY